MTNLANDIITSKIIEAQNLIDNHAYKPEGIKIQCFGYEPFKCEYMISARSDFGFFTLKVNGICIKKNNIKHLITKIKHKMDNLKSDEQGA